MAKLSHNNRITAFGGLIICAAVFVLCMWLIRVTATRAANKGVTKKEVTQQDISNNFETFKAYNNALKSFQSNTDYPEVNTIKLVNEGLEFFAEGRYVWEKDFKGIVGYHFAFEIKSNNLKRKPEDFDDVCDLEGNGMLISVGYHDGEALEEYANDNGVILKETIQNSIDKTIKLKQDNGYNMCVWTVEGDDVDFGFVKILKCENDVLTVYFMLNVPYGLNDKVEGVVELKKDTGERIYDIQSAIKKIKREKYNTIEINIEEVKTIRQTNKFLPESYFTFLEEVGHADLDWIDLGWNKNTSTNLNNDEETYVKDLLKDHKDIKLEDFYFIAIDNGGSYYAFSRKMDDTKVYVFSDDATDIATYETFE
ncbi:MAG: hypothetical protein K2M75_05925, partial [Clostridia bacterium]|nr:hypothetical protein [Clostridia bacterium]